MGTRITNLPAATSLDGTEVVPVVQSGTTKKVTTAILKTPTGAAGGDLTGSYPSPQLAAVTTAQSNVGSSSVIPVLSTDAKGRVIGLSTASNPGITTAQIASFSTTPGANLSSSSSAGTSSFPARMDHVHAIPTTVLSGDVTGSGQASVPTTLAAITTAQYNVGSSNSVPVLSVDAKGRVIALSSAPISGTAGGTVTSVTAGTGLSGGTITDSGTIAIASVTTAQSNVGSSSAIPVLSINNQGQVTSLSTASFSALTTSQINSLSTVPGAALTTTAIAGVSGYPARLDHTHAIPTVTLSGDVTGTGQSTVPSTLATITSAQSNVGSSTQVPVISIDAKGRVTALSTASISSGSGTVTSITAGTGLSGGTITGSGTIAIANVATASYSNIGTPTAIPVLSVNQQGQVTALTTTAPAIPTAAQVGALGATASAGGDLSGNYPNPTLQSITSAKTAIGSSTYAPVISIDAKGRVTALTSVQISALSTADIAGLATATPATLTTAGVVGVSTFAARSDHSHALATIGTAGTFGSGSLVPVLTVDSFGRVSGVSTASINAAQLTSTVSPAAVGQTLIGTSTEAARADHSHSPGVSVEMLIIAGGGGGGASNSGGGGAGGVVFLSTLLSPSTSYAVTVGAAGNGPISGNGGAGGSSSVQGFTAAVGGGGGGGGSSNGVAGGSGGGGASNGAIAGSGGSGTFGQGFAGGSGHQPNSVGPGGGGGGAGGIGGNATATSGGAGGTATSLYSAWAAATSSGVSGAFAGGGGGGINSGAGNTGGVSGGGGGANGSTNSIPAAATANTGGGGGGAGGGIPGGNGGSGIVIIRYPGSTTLGTGGTIAAAGGYVYHKFTSSGTFALT